MRGITAAIWITDDDQIQGRLLSNGQISAFELGALSKALFKLAEAPHDGAQSAFTDPDDQKNLQAGFNGHANEPEVVKSRFVMKNGGKGVTSESGRVRRGFSQLLNYWSADQMYEPTDDKHPGLRRLRRRNRLDTLAAIAFMQQQSKKQQFYDQQRSASRSGSDSTPEAIGDDHVGKQDPKGNQDPDHTSDGSGEGKSHKEQARDEQAHEANV